MTREPDHAALRLACPRCQAVLDGLRCAACGGRYPVLDGIPWLFAEPLHAMADWRNRYDHACRLIERDRARVLEALQARRNGAAPDGRDAGTRRLSRLAEGQAAYLDQLRSLLGPVLGEGQAPFESHVALRTRLPETQGLLTYESNVFRDWCWGGAENAAALAEVLGALQGRVPRRILVLGSGAGRLAYDLHQATTAELTVALDLNPLLACVGLRVSRGERLSLTEFPLAPRSAGDVAVTRELAAPAASRPGLAFALGDVLRAPFQGGAFDLVVSPWLLDILEVPAATVIAGINRLLQPGGVWINHGSVGFGHADPADRLTGEELLEQAGECGFGIGCVREIELPYLCSPGSRHHRVERVLTFSAERRQACAPPACAGELPAWLAEGTVPVPALPEFRAQALATRTHAYIMSLVDGRRSLADIARVLARHQLIDEAGGLAALRHFFTTLHDEAVRSRGL